MNRSPITRTTITKTLLLGLILLAFAASSFGHGGFDHVIGTVVKADAGSLIVKTAKGNVTVKLDDKTEITRGDSKAGVADLKRGVRVIVDIPEGNKEMLAHSVKVGVSAADAKVAAKDDDHDHDHDAQK
jgi:hypothetical protein